MPSHAGSIDLLVVAVSLVIFCYVVSEAVTCEQIHAAGDCEERRLTEATDLNPLC